MKIGLNVGGVDYYTPQPFLDRNKNGAWIDSPWTTNGEPVNANSPGNRLVQLDSTGSRFIAKWTGTATITIPWGTLVSSQPGRVVFDWPDQFHNHQCLVVVSGSMPSTLNIVRLDEEAALDAGQVFRKESIEDFSGWDWIRFLGWTNANNSVETSYLIQDNGLSWGTASNGYGRQVPLDVIIDLCNLCKTRPWLTLPLYLSDAAITTVAQRCQQRLQYGPAIFEMSNELWNTQFQQTQDALARPEGPTQFIANKIDRMIELVKPYGGQPVAMYQFVVPARIEDVLNKMQHVNDLWAIGAADYIAGDLVDTTKPTALALMGANNITGALDNIRASLPTQRTLYDNWMTLCRKWGKPYVGYEGGNFHLNTYQFGANGNALAAFYKTVQEDPRAPAILNEMINQAEAAGMSGVTLFSHYGNSTIYGYFGLRGTPSWAMYRNLLAKPTRIPTTHFHGRPSRAAHIVRKSQTTVRAVRPSKSSGNRTRSRFR